MCFCFYRLQCQIFDAECTECIWEMRWENEDKDEKRKTQIVNEAEMFKKKVKENRNEHNHIDNVLEMNKV